jgi:hypothetical protein
MNPNKPYRSVSHPSFPRFGVNYQKSNFSHTDYFNGQHCIADANSYLEKHKSRISAIVEPTLYQMATPKFAAYALRAKTDSVSDVFMWPSVMLVAAAVYASYVGRNKLSKH